MIDSRVLLVSSRPTASPFFECLTRHHAPPAEWPFAVSLVPADADALARHAREVEGAAVALVDVYPTPEAALRVCRALRAQRPDLPLLALLCCPWAGSPETLRALRAAGASLSGAHATPEQMLADIERVAHGDTVLHVHPPACGGATLDAMLAVDAPGGCSARAGTHGRR